MSDEQQFEEGLGGDTSGLDDSAKGGFLPELVLKILKWVALGLVAAGFCATITVVTVTILLSKGGQGTGRIPVEVSTEYSGSTPIYEFESLGSIRGQTADEPAQTFMIEVSLGYDPDDKAGQTEIINRKPQLKDEIRTFFMEKTSRQIRKENEIKAELKNRLNYIMEEDPVRSVIFPELAIMDY